MLYVWNLATPDIEGFFEYEAFDIDGFFNMY